MKVNVYGRLMEVTFVKGKWEVFLLGEGKKRPAEGIVIPAHIKEGEVIDYLSDLFHESARSDKQIIRVD